LPLAQTAGRHDCPNDSKIGTCTKNVAGFLPGAHVKLSGKASQGSKASARACDRELTFAFRFLIHPWRLIAKLGFRPGSTLGRQTFSQKIENYENYEQIAFYM
jgi:hypothetical protein